MPIMASGLSAQLLQTLLLPDRVLGLLMQELEQHFQAENVLEKLMDANQYSLAEKWAYRLPAELQVCPSCQAAIHGS